MRGIKTGHKHIWNRLGETAELYSQNDIGSNEFNNPIYEWELEDRLLVIATNQDLATDSNLPTGEFDVDEQRFWFREEETPDNGDRLKLLHGDDTVYELQSPTPRGGYIEVVGKTVREENPLS